MDCPNCGHGRSRVIDSRTAPGGEIRRRRRCQKCGHRYTTYEQISHETRSVRKRGGMSEPFDVRKIEHGVRLAFGKVAPSEEDLRLLVNKIVTAVMDDTDGVIPSHVIGEHVEDHLREIDTAAYMRYRSVRCSYTDATDFMHDVQSLGN